MITTTYDPILSNLLPFPSGFVYDLSLVTVEAPAGTPARILSLDGTPHVIDWGDYRNVLGGDPIFVMGFTVVTGSLLKRTGFGISRSAQQTLAEGSEYLWDKQTLS